MTNLNYDDSCIFCKIIKGEIPCTKVYENEHVLAFNDIHPRAPVHILVVPKEHIRTVLDIKSEKVYWDMFSAVNEIAKRMNFDESGFRTVINCNREGGQLVYHVHLHLLAGRCMGHRIDG